MRRRNEIFKDRKRVKFIGAKNMKIHLKFLAIIILLIGTNITSFAQTSWLENLKKQEWLKQISQIYLLESSATDVERILGKPEYFDEGFLGRDFIKSYTIASGRVTVTYITERCKAKNGEVKKDTVEEINFSPAIEIKLADLRLPLSQFEKSKEDDTPIEFYTNEEYGIEIEVQNNEVTGIDFTPPKSLNFECKNQ